METMGTGSLADTFGLYQGGFSGQGNAALPPFSFDYTSHFNSVGVHRSQGPRLSVDAPPMERVLSNIQKAMRKVEERTLYGGTPQGTEFLRKYNTLMESHAVYIPFTVMPPEGHNTFTDILFICDSVHGEASTHADMQIAKFHEVAHFLQWKDNYVLHATPYNVATNKVLSLSDAIVSIVLTEQEAYGKQALLSWIAASTDPHVYEASRKYGTSVAQFEDYLQSTGDVSAAIMQAGRDSMNAIAKGTGYNMFDHYCQQVINNYNKSRYLNDPTNNAEFVVMGEDIRQMGNVFGVKGLDHDGPESYEAIVSRFSPATVANIRSFDERHGHVMQAELPSLHQALLSDGDTPAEFMQYSKQLIRTPAAAGTETGAKPGAVSYAIPAIA